MSADQSSLARIQSIASILAAITIPVVLAAFGYSVQQSIAKDGINTDYVSIAMEILREDGSAQDSELKKWAVTVVEKYSPVPFSENAAKELERIQYIKPSIPVLPEVARQESLEVFCESTYTQSFALKIKIWMSALDEGSNGFEVLRSINDESLVRSLDLACALDKSRVSGSA